MNNEITTTNENFMAMAQTERTEDGMIAKLTDTKNMSYCSMKANTPEEKITLFNAMNNAEYRIKEQVNMELKIKDVFVEVVQCVNEQTGEVKDCPRTVLIDDEDKGYTAVSVGVLSSLQKIFLIFGQPSAWETPLIIVPKVISKGNRQITTLSVKGFAQK